jgi:hypothetical protein
MLGLFLGIEVIDDRPHGFRVVRSKQPRRDIGPLHQPANRAGGLPRSDAHVPGGLIELHRGARVIKKSKP